MEIKKDNKMDNKIKDIADQYNTIPTWSQICLDRDVLRLAMKLNVSLDSLYGRVVRQLMDQGVKTS